MENTENPATALILKNASSTSSAFFCSRYNRMPTNFVIRDGRIEFAVEAILDHYIGSDTTFFTKLPITFNKFTQITFSYSHRAIVTGKQIGRASCRERV